MLLACADLKFLWFYLLLRAKEAEQLKEALMKSRLSEKNSQEKLNELRGSHSSSPNYSVCDSSIFLRFLTTLTLIARTFTHLFFRITVPQPIIP